MVNRIGIILIWILLVCSLSFVIWLILDPIIWWTDKSEYRLYIRSFLIMFAVSTFSTLRLYNSIVQNTRFSIKLREALLKFINVAPGLERSMKNLNSSLGNVRASSEALKKSVMDNTDEVQRLTEKITKAHFIEKNK